MEEGRRLQRISRTAKDPVKLRRAIVVLMSAQGQTVKDITTLMQVGEDYVREVIHAFNERGFDALDPKWSGGRPKTINDEVREHICLIARTSPADWKITAFSTWSLSKLADHLVRQKVTAAISRETPASWPCDELRVGGRLPRGGGLPGDLASAQDPARCCPREHRLGERARQRQASLRSRSRCQGEAVPCRAPPTKGCPVS
ncbi:helix-turn-helix domain-containing protein [Streptomyces sp. NPDC002159]